MYFQLFALNFCQTFAFISNMQFYTYLLSYEECRTESRTLEQYPCNSLKLFKKSCPLSCFTEIYSPLEKSINPTPLLPRYLDVHFCTKFQRSKSVFFDVTSITILSPPPLTQTNFSPISVIFLGEKRQKKKEKRKNNTPVLY